MTSLKLSPGRALASAIACAAALAACACDDESDRDGTTPVTSQQVRGPAGSLFVTDGGGDGLPVVFLHSFAGNSEHWRAQLAHVRPERRAIALDFRAHGKSDPPDNGDYSVDALSADLEAVIAAHDVPRFVLVGHSMGGSAAVRYAGTHRDQVAGLMLVGTPGKTAPEKASQTLAALRTNYQQTMDGYWQSLVQGAKPEVAERLLAEGKEVPQDAAMAMIDATFAYDPLPALDAYTGPKMLVDTRHGDGPDALHNEEPEIPRVVIEGTSHWPQLDKPDEFNAILDDFVRNAERAQ